MLKRAFFRFSPSFTFFGQESKSISLAYSLFLKIKDLNFSDQPLGGF
jgi:hypothetical protein